jgi:hypothetical protein
MRDVAERKFLAHYYTITNTALPPLNTNELRYFIENLYLSGYYENIQNPQAKQMYLPMFQYIKKLYEEYNKPKKPF